MANVAITIEVPEAAVPRIRKALEAFTSIPDEEGEPPVKVPIRRLLRETLRQLVVQQERGYTAIEPPTVT